MRWKLGHFVLSFESGLYFGLCKEYDWFFGQASQLLDSRQVVSINGNNILDGLIEDRLNNWCSWGQDRDLDLVEQDIEGSSGLP